MKRLTFFSVLRNNLKCAFCKNKDCRLRYLPNRKEEYYYSGTRFVEECPKDKEKSVKQALNNKN